MQKLNGNAKEQGFYMPAQWMPHKLTILAFPFQEEEWQGGLLPVRREFMAFLRQIAEDEPVLLILAPQEAASFAEVQRILQPDLANAVHLRLVTLPLNDVWMRDISPIHLISKNTHNLIAVKWQFNGWGGKFSHHHDCEVGYQLMELTGVSNFFDVPIILEGGAVEVDGRGNGMTTRSCLLNPNRSGLGEDELSQIIKDYFGLEKLVWLDQGLVGDHTDGHIDMMARFTPSGDILINHTDNPQNRHYQVLKENYQQLSREFDGSRLICLPLPEQTIEHAVYEDFTELGCANYANFYATTRSVIVPAFADPADEVAHRIIASCFPNHQVVSLSARSILQYGGGIFNCLVQQVPQG